MIRIGIDLGGTNIAVGAVNERHEIIARCSVPTGAERPAQAVIADMCAAVEEALDIACAVVDANDIDVEILGRSPSLASRPDEALADLIRDNPAGQDDELTPFIIVRDIGDREAMPYVPVEAIPEPPQD